MFIESQSLEQLSKYKQLLAATGALSRMFSVGNSPYLHYRLHEQIFCMSFSAQDRSRSDMSVDATKGVAGVGLKTFLHGTGCTYQKIAEFNADRYLYKSASDETAVQQISSLRNERLKSTMAVYGLETIMYHCVTRSDNKMMIFEKSMDFIDINRIARIKNTGAGLDFSDGLNDYRFNLSKSTLFMKFSAPASLVQVPVRILTDPFESILKLAGNVEDAAPLTGRHIILPLYSASKTSRTVHHKSGLNQWNAGGRSRDDDEVYIPIPAWIHRVYPRFFPHRDTVFNLYLPNAKVIQAKVCQQGDKALMSNPNNLLGKWILRDILRVPKRKVVTYDKLADIGIDSVVVNKRGDSEYEIDFRPIGSYESFKETHSDSN